MPDTGIVICHGCGRPFATGGFVRRQDVCPSCGRDIRVCRNCRFHDPGAYNQCREPQAERVVEKDRSNACDYFSPASPRAAGSASPPPAASRDRLEKLFRKD